ncbi:Acid sphingomyelin phosphodiesterase C-terminal region [Popillia japonica]|uniref:Acid sphingomyelin phosphodiesterase C-terminal region n=1 Tax=Popillia japonica TaxID=7064 RepID=A0AAW1JEY0_POPJA
MVVIKQSIDQWEFAFVYIVGHIPPGSDERQRGNIKFSFILFQVYIVGHIPPGSDERQRGNINHKTLNYDDYHNKKYLELVQRYSSVIVGQFFGHLHSDSFRVIYNKRGRPVSWAMLAPAVTPRQTPDGSNNPGLRLYRFNKNTGHILDYTQYYLDLPTANLNSKSEPEWVVEYNFTSYYGISNITPLALHNLADKLTLANDQSTFAKYFRANSVKMYNNPQGNCDANCAHTHYCAITRVDYEEHEQCLKTAASALASSSTAAAENVRRRSDLYILMLTLIAITTYRVR